MTNDINSYCDASENCPGDPTDIDLYRDWKGDKSVTIIVKSRNQIPSHFNAFDMVTDILTEKLGLDVSENSIIDSKFYENDIIFSVNTIADKINILKRTKRFLRNSHIKFVDFNEYKHSISEEDPM